MNNHDKIQTIKRLLSLKMCDYEYCSDKNDEIYPGCEILNTDITYHKCPCVKFGVDRLAIDILKSIDPGYKKIKEINGG